MFEVVEKLQEKETNLPNCQIMTIYFVWVQRINFSKTISILTPASLKNIFIKKIT